MKELVCITGMDAAGKTTLIERLAAELKSSMVAGIWDAMQEEASGLPFKSKKDIDTYLCTLTPDSRLMFLAYALKISIDKALSSDKQYIILNAYYYKYFATELALGATKELVHALIKNFPVPDKIIYLDMNVEEAANRKAHFSRYECGLADKPDKNSFLEFQSKVIECWNTYDKTTWTTLDASLSPDVLFHETLKIIRGA